MGATDFHNSAKADGQSIDTVFQRMVNNALHDYGHAGYSGTIAEKSGYHLVNVNPGFSIFEVIGALCDDEYGEDGDNVLSAIFATKDDLEVARELYADKWGPAIAVKIDGEYHFFGYASS